MSIQIKKHLPSGTIVLNRPDKRNALSRQMLTDLIQALDDFHQEKSVRAVIITGAGIAFCAGTDLAEVETSRQQADALWQWQEDAALFRELIDKMFLFPKPIIAAVNGPALGNGAGLVLAADLVVASTEAQFGLPEPRRGLVAGVSAPLLAFRIGAAAAARLLLTGQTVNAAEAQQLGIWHETVPGDLVWARAHELAVEVSKAAPEAIQLTKRLLNETIGEHLGAHFSSGVAATATARTMEAAAEGIAAFLEKRDAKWQ